jgi:Family of unknown function (DUF6678)
MFDRAQYTSYANDTKWSELQHAMVSLHPRAPDFRVKTLNWHGEPQWDGEWYYRRGRARSRMPLRVMS